MPESTRSLANANEQQAMTAGLLEHFWINPANLPRLLYERLSNLALLRLDQPGSIPNVSDGSGFDCSKRLIDAGAAASSSFLQNGSRPFVRDANAGLGPVLLRVCNETWRDVRLHTPPLPEERAEISPAFPNGDVCLKKVAP